MAKNVQNNQKVATTVDNVEEQLKSLNSLSKGVEAAREEIQKRNDERAKQNAMTILGEAEYINKKTLVLLQFRRKQERVTKPFLEKTKALLDFVTGSDESKNNDYYKKLVEKYKTRDQFTTTDWRNERQAIVKEFNSALSEVTTWKDENVDRCRSLLSDYGLWRVEFGITF